MPLGVVARPSHRPNGPAAGPEDMFVSLDLVPPPPPVRRPGGPGAAPAGGAQALAVIVGKPSGTAAERVARDGGFEVVRLNDAASAEDLLSHRSADLIVLDGGLDGPIDFRACLRLASLRAGAVLVITDTDDEVDRVLALELGADDCVSPRCGDRELVARMRALARRGGFSNSPSTGSKGLRFSDFRLDLATGDLRRLDGTRVSLPRSEYDLLCLFLSNPARVLSPDDICAACKGDGWLDPRNASVRVSRLRRRLRAEAGRDLIRTVHGLGYIFDAPVARA